MAITILQRPEGHILNSTAIDCDVANSVGDALFGDASHGLVNGDFIYTTTYIEEYNGFFEVEKLDANSFYILDPITGSRVSFVQAISHISGDFGQYYVSTTTHGWSCVHLPITYRLSTDLYPVNISDTTRTINSVQNSNGYTVILLSGSLGSGVNSFDFVKIEAPSDTELSKVYQIVEFISPTVMIINLEYDSGNNFTGATALKHYNNYNIIVRVYAGINASHTWAAQKPYELAATIPYIPDDNNEAFFSINEILKSYIKTRNNLILRTLPNNIDFWTNFYIEVAESYDDSDGYAFGTFTSNYTSDQSNFEGTAVNAKLEFKNLQSGYLSEYLMTNNTAKFLTLFAIPVFFTGCNEDNYFDVSYLLDYDSINGTEFKISVDGIKTTLPDYGSGVYRSEIQLNQLSVVAIYLSAVNNVINGTFNADISGWEQSSSGQTWAYNAAPGAAEVTVTGVQSSKWMGQEYTIVSGATYNINYESIMSSVGVYAGTLTISTSNSIDGASIDIIDNLAVSDGTHIESASFTATQNAKYIRFIVNANIP